MIKGWLWHRFQLSLYILLEKNICKLFCVCTFVSSQGSKHKVDQNQMQFKSALFSHLLQQKIKGLEVSHSVGCPGA